MSKLDHDKNVWLIWQSIPENTDIYYLASHMLSDAEYDILNMCHNCFLGIVRDSDTEKAITTLSEWLSKDGKFAHCKVLTTSYPPETLKPSKVVVTGIWL